MNEGQDGASAQDQMSMDQLQQELHAKDLLLEALKYENNSLKQYNDRHYDPTSTPDWKSYDALKRKVLEYQKALEQRDHMIGQMETGIKQFMHQNVESEAKGRKAEEYYSREIQTLAQQVQKLTAQLTITSHQHQTAMRAAQDHFTQQLDSSQQHMRNQHESEVASLMKKHTSEMAGVTFQVEALEKSQREEHLKLVEHLSHLETQLEEEKGKILRLQREKEEWEVHKKELEAESEERESLRRSLCEHIAAREEVQERLRKQVERQLEEEGKLENLRKVSESLTRDLKTEIDQRKIMETKLEQEILNARKFFEQKTALEVNQKQLTLQLLVAEEELAKAAASRVNDTENLGSLGQEKEALIQENEVLTKDKEALTKEKKCLTADKETLSSVNQALTKEKEDLISSNEVLTKEKERLTLQSEALTKEKETLASEYKMLTKEKEVIALEKSRILADRKLKEKEKEHLVKEVEDLTKLKDSLIIEKKDYVMEKDLWTREKETLLIETEAWATEKENLLTEKESLLLEKKTNISEKEALVKENVVLSSEKEVESKGKEEMTTHIDTLMSEKNILLKEKDDLVSEKHIWTKEKTALLQRIEVWTTEKEDLLLEKESLLSENKAFLTEKETLDKEKINLSHQNDTLCSEKNNWSLKEESLNKKNELLSTEREVLAEQNRNLVNEKEHLIQENKSYSNEKEMLTKEKESLMKQVYDLTVEKENLLKLTEEITQKNVDLATEKETLTCQISILQREKEAVADYGDQVNNEALKEEVRSLKEEMEVRQIERKHLEEKCAHREAELKELEEKYTQTVALKESYVKELEESYKNKFISKDLELQELEENFKEKFSLKEKEVRELEDMFEKKCSQKDHKLKELSEKIAIKENELQELRNKDRVMEELHKNCLGVLEHLQSGEKERKKIEEECEDKCEMLNTVLRNIDVKLCEAASLVSKQRIKGEEEVQGAGPCRSHLVQTQTEVYREKEIQPPKLKGSETAHASMERDKGEREEENYKLLKEIDHVKGKLEEGKRNEEVLVEQLTLSEKEKKQLANEAEVMRKKIHDQHFTITSLHNEKSRLGQYIIQLEGERSTLRAEETRHLKDNLNTQKELSTLRAKVTAQKQKLELQEEEIIKIDQTLTSLIRGGIDCPEKLRDTVKSLNCLSSKLKSFVSSENVDDSLWLTVMCQELDTQWEHQHTTLGHLIDLQHHTDTLHQDKLQTDLENISLSAKLDYLRDSTTHVESGMDQNLERKPPEEDEGNGNEDSLLNRMREENKMLKQCLDNKSLLLRLERLHSFNPKPNFERELHLCLRERKVVMQVVRIWLDRFLTQLKLHAETHPTLLVFAESFDAYIEDLSGHLLGINNGDDMSAEVVVRCLQQAMVKGVSQEYQEAIRTTLGTLEQDLSRTLHHITLPPSLLDTPQKPSTSLEGASLQDATQEASLLQGDDTHKDSFSTPQKDSSSLDPQNYSHYMTARVEHLINVRTTLVDAANEFNEELQEALGQCFTLLKEQLQEVVKDGKPNVREGGSCLPSLPQHQAFIQEFTDFTSRVSHEAHTEKLQVLRNQQEMVHKILEDNQAKLNTVCRAFLESIHGLTSVEEMEGKGKALVDSLESTLAEEATWVEKQYRDLLKHYTQEQDNNNQAHAVTRSHLVHTLIDLFQSTNVENKPKELRQEHTREVKLLQEEHNEEIQRLEAQLAAKDQEALEIIDEEIAQLESDTHYSLSGVSSTLSTQFNNIRIQVTKQHLQGLYNDRDWYKKTVGLLSHVTLQLLHYYSVAQSLTHQPLEDASSPPPQPPESPTPGRVLDLSFLSDCVGEDEEEMLAFSEDGALATGLIGRTTMGPEGEVEDTESALDGTAISEGMMDDLDKDEQVRTLLERSYPQLMAILKGRWDRVQVTRLEKEVQELTISLQASAGMLRIFIHSVSNNGNDLPSCILKDEVQEESVKNSMFEASHSEPCQESDDLNKESNVVLNPNAATTAKDATVPPSPSILQQDLSCISEGLMQLLSQEESLPNFTMLEPYDLQDKEQLKAILRQVCEAAQAMANLKLDLHHALGLQQGLEEERHNLQDEVTRLTHYSKKLARELQVLKDQLEETGQESQRPVSQYAAKMEATKDVRERVRAALSAKNVAELERGQLEARVRELEGLLEVVVRESEVALEVLRTRETDLSQQLEVADRQLKSARQFLDEHASERDQEVDELVAVRDKLTLQLREREAQLVFQAAQEKEICDLREIIQSLESQVDTHCIKEAELSEQVEALSDALTQAQQQAQHLSSKVEELRPEKRKQVEGQKLDEISPDVTGDKAEGNTCQYNTSLLSELQEDVLSTSVLFHLIEKRLRDTTRGLEAMQLSGSLEDISAEDVEVMGVGGEGRLSPATVDRRLEHQLMALECTTEAAIKRNKDLQLTIKNLQAEYEEVSAERDTLQERSREQLVKISGLEARLDEVRRADHPAAADLRHRLALLQEDLEKKREELTKKGREGEELKHTLSNLREQLTNREGELERLQSASLAQPHSFPLTAQDHLAASHAHLEKDLAHKTHLLESLQKELIEGRQPSLPPTLAEDLLSEKNAEISELSNKVEALMCVIQKVSILLKQGGNLYEAQQMLSHVLGREFCDELNESEEQDVLRRGEPERIPSLTHNDTIKEAAVMQVSPVPLRTMSDPEEDSVHSQLSAADFSLMSAQPALYPELAQVSQLTEDEQQRSQHTPVSEVTPSQPESQAQLEEDFKSAQEVLEAREAEILQLTEEGEDAPPMPLPTPLPHHPGMDMKQEVSSKLRAYEEEVDYLSSALQRKSEEVQQLSTQLEHVHTEMKGRLSQANREAACLEQQFQQEISDLKEQHIAREKKLCGDYEDRMAKQVEDVAQHMNKNKETAMARQQEVFEAALRQAALERDRAERELQLCHAASPSALPQAPPQSHPPDHQTAAQLCASVDTLIAGLKQELEKSGQLDLSMASLMKAGESGEASTRASSTLSDASDGEEPASINGKIQHLMSKIHKEGIEVLSLIDIMFLCKHCTQLDTSQRSFITNSNLIARSLLERGGAGEQTQLMRNLAAVEEELTKKEQEMKRKIGVLEFQLEQERMSGSEWRLSFESEKQHTRDLMEQLRKERLAGAEQVSELTLLRSQLIIIRIQHQKLQEENCSLSECQEKKDKQIENLHGALQMERSNFSRVSKVLSEERKVSGLTHSEQETIIRDLRSTLEKERERTVALCSHFERMTSQQSKHLPTPATSTRKKSDSSRPTTEELQVQLAVERERRGKLERACERERLQVVSQKEQATAERLQSKVEARKAEGRIAELTRTVRSLETEKQRLVRQMSHEKERLQHQDSRIKELDGEMRRLEADSRAQSEAHQAMSDRMREEGTQLHLAYTRTLTKLGEVEAEVCELRHKLRTVSKELQLAMEQEEQLKQDLHTERTAVDQLGLPSVMRMMDPDGCSDLQVKENLELCRSMLRLTDDQRTLRAKIAELEDTVTFLNQQLLQAQETNKKRNKFEEMLKAERRVWETERVSLQNLNQLHEVEADRLRSERITKQNIPGTAEMQQLYGRYLQSEHWRKALVWQKQYLMLVIQGYNDTEQHTLARLTAMTPLCVFPSSTSHSQASHSKGRFRVAALVVVAMCRMKHLVLRFHRKKRLCLEVQVTTHSTASTLDNSQPQSSSSMGRGREPWLTTPQPPNEGAGVISFTGLTPPTREPRKNITPRLSSTTHRSLFQEESEELNQYVERLDTIHSVLGLTQKKQ